MRRFDHRDRRATGSLTPKETDNSSDLSRRESDLMSSYKLEKRALELTEALSKAPPLATLMGMRVNNLG
jgi:hypothetical protein